MISRTQKAVALSLALLCLILTGSLLWARWYAKSGRLKTLVEEKAGESLGADVRIESLSLDWPPRAEIGNLVVSAPGYEEFPLLTCPRLTLAAPLRNLIKGHIDSVVIVSPKIRVFAGEERGSNIPEIPPGDGAVSFGGIKIIDAGIDLHMPGAQIKSKGILATLSAHASPAGEQKIIKLNIDAIDASIARENQEPMPLGVKFMLAKFVHRPRHPGNEIEGEIHAALTAEVPQLILPPGIPIQISFELDHFPARDSIENAIFTFSIPRSIEARAYGSVRNLTGGTPMPDLRFTTSPLDMSTHNEYLEVFQRPKYEKIDTSGEIRVSGTLKGNLADPKVSLRAEVAKGSIKWKD